jgi:acyl carrier protein
VKVHPEDEAQPLSAAQERRWILDRLVGRKPIQQAAYLLRLRGALDARALSEAVATLWRRHAILRCRFRLADAGVVHEIEAAEGVRSRVDLSGLKEDPRRWEAERLVVLESRRAFNLSRPSMLRIVDLILGGEYHQLLLTAHRIGLDRVSTPLLAAELAALYNAHRGEGEAPPEPAVQFLEVAAWQQRWVRELAASLLYWRRRLQDLPERLDLPTDRPRRRYRSGRSGRYQFALHRTLGTRVLQLAEGADTESLVVFLAVLVALLHRLTGSSDLAVGVPVAGRRRRGTEAIPGPFEGAVVVRSQWTEGPEAWSQTTGRGLVARMKRILEEALAHQAVPFAHLLRVLPLPRHCSHHPVFQVRMAVTGSSPEAGVEAVPPPRFHGLGAELEEVDVGHSDLDLDFRLRWDAEGGCEGVLCFSRDLFDPATAQYLVDRYEALLVGVVDQPDLPLAQLECSPWPGRSPAPIPELGSEVVTVRFPCGGPEHRAELHRAVRAAWQAELGIAEFGDKDDFFQLGGTSLILVRIQIRLSRRLGKQLPLVDLYDFPTVSGLADLLVRDPEIAPRIGARFDRAQQQRAARRRRKRPRNSMRSWR